MSGDHAGASTALAAKVRHVEALLEQRGLVDPAELDRALTAFLAKGSPASGARVVARGWVDEGFRQRLLDNANAALPEVGLSMGGGLQEQRLKVVANTASAHHVIACTLCSCYPIALLGPSPSWYKSEGYRSRWCATHGASCTSSATTYRRMSRSRSGTRARSRGTWCCRGGRWAPTACPSGSSRAW